MINSPLYLVSATSKKKFSVSVKDAPFVCGPLEVVSVQRRFCLIPLVQTTAKSQLKPEQCFLNYSASLHTCVSRHIRFKIISTASLQPATWLKSHKSGGFGYQFSELLRWSKTRLLPKCPAKPQTRSREKQRHAGMFLMLHILFTACKMREECVVPRSVVRFTSSKT